MPNDGWLYGNVFYKTSGIREFILSNVTYTKGTLNTMSYDNDCCEKPLNIDREKLIERLNERLAEEQKKRDEENARQTQARLEFQQFLTDHEVEVVGFVAYKLGVGSNWTSGLKALTEVFEANDFSPRALKPTHTENALEKHVRVLGMATDATIEIRPDESIYGLL